MTSYFENNEYHHFVLEFCPGGDLYQYLRSKGKITIDVAKKVMA